MKERNRNSSYFNEGVEDNLGSKGLIIAIILVVVFYGTIAGFISFQLFSCYPRLKKEQDNLELFLKNDSKVEIENELKNTKEDLLNLLEKREEEIPLDINSLEEQIKEQEEKIVSLKVSFNEYEKEKAGLQKMIKGTTVLLDAPRIFQFPNYPTGCESIALLIILRYYGLDISAEQIVELLDKGDRPYNKNGVRYGGNPEIEFLGDPRDSYSYGVYQKPIQKVANYFKPGMIDATGSSLNSILEKVAQGSPVQVWVSRNVYAMYISDHWINPETGETVYWKAAFHSMVIVGYNSNQIICSDPDTGTIRYFDRTKFEKVYNYFGKRALYYE